MAIASYLSFRPIFLIIPLLGLAHSLDSDWQTVYAHGIALFSSACGILVLTSSVMTESFQFLDLCYGIVIKFNKITPNLGLWWYIFTEMFDFFTPFYVGVFNLFSVIFVIPFTLRLFEFNHKSGKPTGDAFLAVVTSYLWLSFTKSYPSVGDLAFALSLIPIFKDTIIPHCKYHFLTALVLLVALLLSPIFYYCWIVLGTGNSNFFYSINLVWGVVHGLILTDLVWGKLNYDYIELNDIPADEVSKLRLTQI
jgi:phosphatidylinositol glycan class U